MIKASLKPLFLCRQTPFHDKLFPIDQRDVLINSIVLLVQVVPRFLFLCRQTPFMISSFQLTDVMY